jgi:hypothetical protein
MVGLAQGYSQEQEGRSEDQVLTQGGYGGMVD